MTIPFSYELPLEKIAQRPAHPYDAARMLVVHRSSGRLEDTYFRDLPQFLSPTQLLVFNNTAVLKARLFGFHADSKKEVELLLLEEQAPGDWLCLGKPSKRLQAGMQVDFAAGLSARVNERTSDGRINVTFARADGGAVTLDDIGAAGVMPIPPYIRDGRADSEDELDYQTPFAERPGSVAAPTASLHFTTELRAALSAKGIAQASITLHLGAASFRPLHHADEKFDSGVHRPGAERLIADESLLGRLKSHRRGGGKVVAIGTSVVRALESLARANGAEALYRGGVPTDLFIEPGFGFEVVDSLVTNFHQPRTTHLLLVEAFLGRELLAHVYQHALNSDYRFLSYGDGMLIL